MVSKAIVSTAIVVRGSFSFSLWFSISGPLAEITVGMAVVSISVGMAVISISISVVGISIGFGFSSGGSFGLRFGISRPLATVVSISTVSVVSIRFGLSLSKSTSQSGEK